MAMSEIYEAQSEFETPGGTTLKMKEVKMNMIKLI